MKKEIDQIYHVSVNPLRKITTFLHAGLFFCDPQLMFVSHVTEQLCMQILRCLTKNHHRQVRATETAPGLTV